MACPPVATLFRRTITAALPAGDAAGAIDQTEFLETGWDTSDDYHGLIRRFPTHSPKVLIDRASGKPWSAQPKLYDLNVILPPAVNVRIFGDQVASTFGGAGLKSVEDLRRLAMGSLTVPANMQHASWLSPGGAV